MKTATRFIRTLVQTLDDRLVEVLEALAKGAWFSGPYRQPTQDHRRAARVHPVAQKGKHSRSRARALTLAQQGTGAGMTLTVINQKPLLIREVEKLDRFVTAWRFWKIDADETGLSLRSLVVAVSWPKGQLLSASCKFEETNHHQGCKEAGPHSAPLFEGECGIYGYRTTQEALHTSLHEKFMQGRIIGQVALAGIGIDHDMGYRSHLAYPLRLVAAGCAEGGHLISLSQARLVERDEKYQDKPEDSTFTIFCEEHASGAVASFDWLGMLERQYGLTLGELSEFISA